MQTGLGIWVWGPVGWRRPVWGWMRKVTMVLVSWVGGQEPSTGGVDGEVAGSLALGGFVAQAGQAAGGLVDREHGDAVVAAVGAVDELA